MKSIILFFPRRTLILIISLIVLITLLLILMLIGGGFGSGPKSIPIPNPILMKQVSPLQKTQIGKTSIEDVQKLPTVLNKETLPNGSVKFTLKSEVSPRNDEVIIKDKAVVLEKRSLPLNPDVIGFTSIPQMESEYGKPEKVIASTINYGPFSSTYIYASRGFAFIGNPNNNTVFELQFFSPTSVDEYIRLYGDNIGPSSQANE